MRTGNYRSTFNIKQNISDSTNKQTSLLTLLANLIPFQLSFNPHIDAILISHLQDIKSKWRIRCNQLALDGLCFTIMIIRIRQAKIFLKLIYSRPSPYPFLSSLPLFFQSVLFDFVLEFFEVYLL